VACGLQVLARAITKGCNAPVNDYLKMTNKKKVVIRDINPKSISTQELYGFVNMATREWKVRRPAAGGRGGLGVGSLGVLAAAPPLSARVDGTRLRCC
jgi:hypothetical protein